MRSFFSRLSLFWKEMYCFDFHLEPCARISGGVQWATSDCGACSDTPASEFCLSPQESELGKYLPSDMFGFVDFCLCFLLLVTVTSCGSDGAQGGDRCQWALLAIFTPSIRSLKGFLLEKLIFLKGSEKIIFSGGLGYFTWLYFSGRLISELSLFNESLKTGDKSQLYHNTCTSQKGFLFSQPFFCLWGFSTWFNLPDWKSTFSSNGMASEFLIDLHVKSFSDCQAVTWKTERQKAKY